MATHDPRSVVVAALMHPVPCPRCGSATPCRCVVDPGERFEWQAGLIVAALEESGHIPTPDAEAAQTVEQVAAWLAEQSGHPRYTAIKDGWRSLLDPASENNIHHAHAAALKAHPQPSREFEASLAAARDRLLTHVAERRAAGNAG